MDMTHTNYKGLNYVEKSASSKTKYEIKLFYWNKWSFTNSLICTYKK